MAESSDEENVAAAYSSHSDKSEEPDISDNVPEEEDISDNIPESEDSADNYSDGSSNYSSDNDSDGSVGQLDLGKDLASWLVKYNVPREGTNELLCILRQHGHNLPKRCQNSSTNTSFN